MFKGSCLCGEVTYQIDGQLRENDGCHCTQCRKWTGHFLTGVAVSRKDITINGTEHLSWYHSSEKVRRGFCAKCGSSLFFDPTDTQKHDWISVAMGTFDTPTNTALQRHIFVAEKGDYYQLNDGLPQNEY